MRGLLLATSLGCLIIGPGHAAPEAAADQAQIVVLVRHAEKAETPPRDVALNEAGLARAEELAITLAEARVNTIVTSQYRRARDTAGPTARAHGLTPVVVQADADTARHVRAVAEVVRKGGVMVLVVGHSNTLPAIIGALGGPTMSDLCDTEYSNLFTLALVPGQQARLVHGHYGAPDPPSAPDCGKTMGR
jgi:broad specificity phosphatase PhoE